MNEIPTVLPPTDEVGYAGLIEARKSSIAIAAAIAARIAGIPATAAGDHRKVASEVLDDVGIVRGTDEYVQLTGVILDSLAKGSGVSDA